MWAVGEWGQGKEEGVVDDARRTHQLCWGCSVCPPSPSSSSGLNSLENVMGTFSLLNSSSRFQGGMLSSSAGSMLSAAGTMSPLGLGGGVGCSPPLGGGGGAAFLFDEFMAARAASWSCRTQKHIQGLNIHIHRLRESCHAYARG